MRKFFLLSPIAITLFALIYANSLCMPAQALTFGSFKTETEYGLIDGFKFNVFNRKENDKIIQIKSETEEEKTRLEKLKEKPEIIDEDRDYQNFKFMIDETIPL